MLLLARHSRCPCPALLAPCPAPHTALLAPRPPRNPFSSWRARDSHRPTSTAQIDISNEKKNNIFAKRHAKLTDYLGTVFNPSLAEFGDDEEHPEEAAAKIAAAVKVKEDAEAAAAAAAAGEEDGDEEAADEEDADEDEAAPAEEGKDLE